MTKQSKSKQESKPVENYQADESADGVVSANPVNTSTEPDIAENGDSTPVQEEESGTTKDTTDLASGERGATGAIDSDSPSEKKPKTASKKEKVPELSPNIEACPRCKHVSSVRAIKLGPPRVQSHPVVVHGKRYNTVSWQTIICEKCRQHHIVKKFT